MNNKTIDLHGLSENDAIGIISVALFEIEIGDVDSIEFITGKGDVLTRVLEDLVSDSGLEYKRNPNNMGSYIVF